MIVHFFLAVQNMNLLLIFELLLTILGCATRSRTCEEDSCACDLLGSGPRKRGVRKIGQDIGAAKQECDLPRDNIWPEPNGSSKP